MAGNDILERAALALANSQGGPIDSLDELDDDFRAGLIEDVRAVLGAIREMDQHQVQEIARECWWPFHGSRSRTTALRELEDGSLGEVTIEYGDFEDITSSAWRATIDAAVAE